MMRYLINPYDNGWEIQYGSCGRWNIWKDGKHYGTFYIYREAEAELRRLQEEERCRQNPSCLEQVQIPV